MSRTRGEPGAAGLPCAVRPPNRHSSTRSFGPLAERDQTPREVERLSEYVRNARVRKGYRWLRACGSSREDALDRLARVWGLDLSHAQALVERKRRQRA